MRTALIHAKLRGLEAFGIKPGLARITRLLSLMGDPQRGLRVVHVAGTNGKGSVCALLDSVLRASGLRVGLYTSPHLVRLEERFVLGGRPIGARDLEASFKAVWPAVEAMRREGDSPTLFEATTALALHHFARKKADVVVLEVGLGGRFDATNVFGDPLATVVTQIDLEHTQVLGRTVERIAYEKAGIAKPGADLVTAAQGGALKVIRREWALAQRAGGRGTRKARLVALAPGHGYAVRQARTVVEPKPAQRLNIEVLGRRRCLNLGLLGPHQHANLACALAVVECLRGRGLKISEAAIRRGVAATRWPGRLQVVAKAPRTILDGAHNPAGARALAAALPALTRGRVALVLGVLADKDWRNVLGPLLPLADHCFFAAPHNTRALAPAGLQTLARKAGVPSQTSPTLPAALTAARKWAAKTDTIVVAGSLYGIGEILGERTPKRG